ncbi:MAG: oligopeptidase A, partial [Zetaproteobacteria bacterium]
DEALVGPALSHAENRALRRRLHRAWAARASRGRFDTTPLILQILALREEAARLLGFPHYAEMALGLRMCSSAARLEAFLEELTRAVRPHAEEEYARLQAFAAKELGLRRLAPHDLAFAMERMRRARFVDEEALRPWFPADQVVAGALAIAERMFGLRFVEEPEAPRWHPEVRCLRVEERGRTRGWLYLDLFMRTGKRGGAWMDEGAIGWRHPQRTTLPVAYIVASFARAEGQEPLWTPSDAETLLHELGHALHLVLCERTRVRSLSGLGGVPWDAVELPSQWLEQAASTPWGLRLLSRHWRTGEPLSRAQIARLIASRRFLGALRLARQLEYAWMDFALHTQPAPADAVELRRRVRQARDRAAVVPRAGYDRTENSFTHIFAGGYAAGYYSYLWAETMAADAWHATAPDARPRIRRARAFRREILAIGGTRPMDEAIRRFLGRPPEMQALLRRWGIEA